MSKRAINRLARTAPIALSLVAFCIVTAAIATGWDKGYSNEGSAAHVFQLLIGAEVPFIVAFVVTADWKRFRRVAAEIVLQTAALALAFAPVAIFRL